MDLPKPKMRACAYPHAIDIELFTREQLIAAIAAEREACAKTAEAARPHVCCFNYEAPGEWTRLEDAQAACAAAIRARKD